MSIRGKSIYFLIGDEDANWIIEAVKSYPMKNIHQEPTESTEFLAVINDSNSSSISEIEAIKAINPRIQVLSKVYLLELIIKGGILQPISPPESENEPLRTSAKRKASTSLESEFTPSTHNSTSTTPVSTISTSKPPKEEPKNAFSVLLKNSSTSTSSQTSSIPNNSHSTDVHSTWESPVKDLIPGWNYVESCLVHAPPRTQSNGTSSTSSTSSNTQSSKYKVAAFDMDDTLIRVKSGYKFPINRQDWQWLYPKLTVDTLQQLALDGYQIVIFSNQAGISSGKQKAEDLKGKILDLSSALGPDVPLWAYLATQRDYYRKPCISMWLDLCSRLGGEIDMEASFYVGDAAGRILNWAPGKPTDHSVVDRKFAANAGLRFYTPEEYFLKEPATLQFSWRTFNPSEYLLKHLDKHHGHGAVSSETKKGGNKKSNSNSASTLSQIPSSTLSSFIIGSNKSIHWDSLLAPQNGQELILMVGCPASGKSTISIYLEKHYGYTRINRDTLGTAAKCMQATKTALKSGKSVVIDNTNPSIKSRQEFMNIARVIVPNIVVRVFWLDTPLELAEHCNMVREFLTRSKRIPAIAYNMYRSKFEEPTQSQGYDQVIKIPWQPNFTSERETRAFLMWTES